MSRTKRGKSKPIDFSKVESLTEQSHLNDVNIHNIVGKHERLGIRSFNVNAMSDLTYFRDHASLPDYHTAMNVVTRGASAFQEVPSRIRKIFGNDAGKFLAFMLDENNREEIEDFGFDTDYLGAPESDSKSSEKQVDLEDMISDKTASVDLSKATAAQLQAQLDKINNDRENNS